MSDQQQWGTTTEAGRMLGVTGETARNWALAGLFDVPGRRAWTTYGPAQRCYRIDLDLVTAYQRRRAAA